MNDVQWIVGRELDEPLRRRLGATLRACGYTVDGKRWGVGGSQELSAWKVSGPRGVLLVEAETYIGLTVTGAAPLIDELKKAFAGSALANQPLHPTPDGVGERQC
jgi:hypothetical protein